MGDTVWDGANRTPFETPDLTNHQPWRYVARGKRTCTVDLCMDDQDVQQEQKSELLDQKDIALALHKENLLRVAEWIQISPNGRFWSIKFNTKEITLTFFTESLVVSENITIYFKLD